MGTGRGREGPREEEMGIKKELGTTEKAAFEAGQAPLQLHLNSIGHPQSRQQRSGNFVAFLRTSAAVD